MSYELEYFHARIKEEINCWPKSILADYKRLTGLLMEFGPNLRMPHSKAIGSGLFEMRARGKEGIGRAFYCYVRDKRIVILHVFIKNTNHTSPRTGHCI